MKEDKIQSECVRWFNNTYCLKHHNPRGIIFSVPNGGTRNDKEAMVLKATGLLAGVSDLILILPNSRILFIEFKTETGTQSIAQKEFESRVTALGYVYVLVRSIDEFKSLIDTYLNSF